MSAFSITVQFTQIECCKCRMVFAMTENTNNQRIRDRESFWCPNGHEQGYAGKSELEKARDELARIKCEAEHAQRRLSEERSSHAGTVRRLNATRGVVTKHKKRVARGQCPCCSHTFKDLREHMHAEHPHWDPEKEAEALSAETAVVVSVVNEPQRLTARQQKILGAIAARPTEALRLPQIAENSGHKYSTVSAEIGGLVRRGLVKRIGYGQYIVVEGDK